MSRSLVFFFMFFIAIVGLLSCRKESFTNSTTAHLRTDADSLHFDTVFTTAGSTSQVIKLFNDNKEGIHISSVRLGGGATSPFKINVDGLPGPNVSNVDLAGNDSLYIFVTVSINPNAASLAFVVTDSIAISYNGNTKWVQLDAYGQNAHFFRNRVVHGNETWNNDLPYVILGGLAVDTNAHLTINSGVRIYMHADAPFVVNGSLQVNGQKWDSTRVVFTGDRLDVPYRDFPASFPGLIFTDVSQNNVLNYAIVKNAYQGIVVSDPSPATKLTLNETIIDNAYDIGLFASNTSVNATNLLVSNCGKDIIITNGGSYNFTHCTGAAYSNAYIQHKQPVLSVSNTPSTATAPNPLSANFRNCIFWGENNGILHDEVIVSKEGTTSFNVSFDGVLWRVQTAPSNANITGAINNQDPSFDSVNTNTRYYSFRLKDDSPAKDHGTNTSTPIDLDGNQRPVGLPDLGAYEKQ